jgi:hypothetical protein
VNTSVGVGIGDSITYSVTIDLPGIQTANATDLNAEFFAVSSTTGFFFYKELNQINRVQAALVIRGLFICEFVDSLMKNDNHAVKNGLFICEFKILGPK